MLIFCSITVHRVSEEAKKTCSLTELAFSASDQQSALKAVSEAKDYWESREWFLGSVLRHADLEDVVQLFNIIKVYAQREDWDDYYGNCAALLARLEHIGESEQLRLKNIL